MHRSILLSNPNNQVPRLLFQWCYVLMEEHKPVIQLRQEATDSSVERHCGRKESRRRIVPSCPAQGVSVTGQQFCLCDGDPWEYSELEEFGRPGGVGGEHPRCICRHVMIPPFLLCYKVFWRQLVHLPVCSLPLSTSSGSPPTIISSESKPWLSLFFRTFLSLWFCNDDLQLVRSFCY